MSSTGKGSKLENSVELLKALAIEHASQLSDIKQLLSQWIQTQSATKNQPTGDAEESGNVSGNSNDEVTATAEKHFEGMEYCDDEDLEETLNSLLKVLSEKEEELRNSEALNNVLVTKERTINDELHGARKELINYIQEVSMDGDIGVKRMGELDIEPFLTVTKTRYGQDKAEERAAKLCSSWQKNLEDPNWHPFKVVVVEGQERQVVKDDDKKLNGLKKRFGKAAYDAAVTALKEINEYNPSGSYVTAELWNYKEKRRATLQEGVKFLVNNQTKKRKRGAEDTIIRESCVKR